MASMPAGYQTGRGHCPAVRRASAAHVCGLQRRGHMRGIPQAGRSPGGSGPHGLRPDQEADVDQSSRYADLALDEAELIGVGVTSSAPTA